MSHTKLAAALHFDDESTVAVVEFLSRLGVVETAKTEVALTDIGKRIAASSIAARKRLCTDLAMRLPIMREITDSLARERSRSLSRARLLDTLGAQACPMDADRVFDHVIAWARYAGLFAYDAQVGVVSLL